VIAFTVIVSVLCLCTIAFLIGVTYGVDRQDQAYHDHCSRIDIQLDREERDRGEA